MKKGILFINGATADKDRTLYLQKILSGFGIQSFSFNYSDYGKLADSSLKKRFADVLDAVDKNKLTGPLTVCGGSMGGYLAIKSTEKYRVGNLILFCPAVYDTAAFEVPFGHGFTDAIRKKDSWLKSDAFRILNKFTGKLLLIIGDRDEVIPFRLTDLILSSATNAESKKKIIIPGAPHMIHTWLKNNEAWAEKIGMEIAASMNIINKSGLKAG